MEQQPSLFESDGETRTAKQWSIQERFCRFHSANPHIYQRLKTIALNLKSEGRKKYGVKALFEKLRWDSDVATDSRDYKLSNDFTSLYARKLMQENKELEGFFNVRPRRS